MTGQRAPARSGASRSKGVVCIGSGGCVPRSPEAFEFDAARQPCVRHELMAPSDTVMDAAENCPVEAITLHDASTGGSVFPPEE